MLSFIDSGCHALCCCLKQTYNFRIHMGFLTFSDLRSSSWNTKCYVQFSCGWQHWKKKKISLCDCAPQNNTFSWNTSNGWYFHLLFPDIAKWSTAFSFVKYNTCNLFIIIREIILKYSYMECNSLGFKMNYDYSSYIIHMCRLTENMNINEQ